MAYSDFNIVEINDRVVDYYRLFGAPFSLMARRYSADTLEVGDDIEVPVLSEIVSTARTKTRTGAYEGDEPSPTKSTLELTEAGYVGAKFNGKDVKRMLRTGDSWDKIAMHIARNVWETAYAEFFAKVVAAAPVAAGNTFFTGSGAAFSYDDLVAIRADVRDKKLGAANIILGGTLFDGLLLDADVKTHPSLADLSRDAMENARVSRLAGMDIADVDYVPDVSPNQVGGIVLNPDSIGIAFAPTGAAGNPGEGGLVDLQYLEIPGTGMVVTYREIYDATTDQRFYIWEHLWGAKVFKTEHVGYLIDTDLAI